MKPTIPSLPISTMWEQGVAKQPLPSPSSQAPGFCSSSPRFVYKQSEPSTGPADYNPNVQAINIKFPDKPSSSFLSVNRKHLFETKFDERALVHYDPEKQRAESKPKSHYRGFSSTKRFQSPTTTCSSAVFYDLDNSCVDKYRPITKATMLQGTLTERKTRKPSRVIVNKIVPPLDFSFNHLVSFSDLVPKEDTDQLSADFTFVRKERSMKKETKLHRKKSNITGVLFKNNELTNFDGLIEALDCRISSITNIRWLDLSFNAFQSLSGKVLRQLPSLSILNLHSNMIQDMRAVCDIKALPSLKSLTLFDNPVQLESNYRLRVICLFPGLRQFDYQVVLTTERDDATRFIGFDPQPLIVRKRARKKLLTRRKTSNISIPAAKMAIKKYFEKDEFDPEETEEETAAREAEERRKIEERRKAHEESAIWVAMR